MSNNFEQFQSKVCDGAPDDLSLKKFCPACTPNKSFIAPDWRQMLEETYLDESDCEYKICVTLNNEGQYFEGTDFQNAVGSSKYPTREHLFRSFVQPAIRLMLQDTDKLIAQQIICASHDGPAVAGRTPNELLQKYDNFDGIFMDLRDDPIAKPKDCPDLLTKSGPLEFNPEEPISFTQFVLQSISNEIKNPFALELYARVIDFDIEPMQGLLKVLVAIPAFILDSVPDNPTGQEIQQSAEATKNEVEIDIRQFFGQIIRLKSALKAYSTYQSHFYQTQDGFLKFKESGSDYYASSFSSKISTFYEDLKAEANSEMKPKKKRWNIRSNTPSVIVKNADKLRITFMTGENGNPYKIKRIEAKIDGCDYQRICGRNSKFAKKYSNKPTVMNYIAKIKEIDTALKARQSYPWLDFLVKFTFPLLVVDYGVLNEESVTDTLGECVANNIEEFGGELRDYVLNEALSLVQAIAYEFNSKESCKDLLAESEIEKKYFKQETFTPGLDARKSANNDPVETVINIIIKKESELESLLQNQQLMESELAEFEAQREMFNEFISSGASDNKTLRKYKNQRDEAARNSQRLQKKLDKLPSEIESLRDALVGLENELDAESPSKKTKKQNKRNLAKQARKANRELGNPYFKEAKKLALEELKYQDGILAQLVDIETFMTTGEITSPKANQTAKSAPEDLLKRLTLCNVKALTINAIQCLFSGVTQEAAFKKIVQAALEAMDIDVMGFFVQGLPPAKQAELREMASQKWADMPMPWEAGFSGGSSQDSNPYLKHLSAGGINSNIGPLKTRLKEDLAKIELDIADRQFESTAFEDAVSAPTSEALSSSEIQSLDEQRSQINLEIKQLEVARNDIQNQLKEFQEEDFSKLPPERQEELIAAQTNAQGTLGTALGDIQSALVDMYIENMMDVLGVDELMSHLDRFPGGQLVQRYLNQVTCSFQGLHNPPIKSFLSTLSFDPCSDGNTALGFPSAMRKFNIRDLKPWRKDFLTIIRNKFIDKLETVLTKILTQMILKLIQTVDDALCKSINAAGQLSAALLTGDHNGLDEAVKDAFCPNADADLDKIKENLFNNALGKGGSGLQAPDTSAYDCLFQTLNAAMSKQEIIGLLTNTPSNMDGVVVTKVSQLVNSRCPALSPVLGDPADIRDCFGSMQKFIPPELRAFLKEQASQVPESPVFDAICLTQEELNKWNSDRKAIYLSSGLDEDIAQELIDKANDRALDDLGTVSNMLQKGPEGLLAEALDDLLNQGEPDCETNPSAIILEDEDLAAEKLDMLNDFFKTIEKKFMSDLIEGRNSILNNILVDTYGFRLNKHERRAGQPFIRPNYVDNEEMLERRKDNFPFQVDVPVLGGFPYDLDKMTGEFPETVGGRMLQKMKNMNLQYDSKAKNTIVMNFKDSEEETDYESKLVYRVLPRPNPTHLVKVGETFHRRISRKEKKKLGLEGSRFGGIVSPNSSRFRVKDFSVQDMTNEIDYSIFEEYFNVETILFRNFLMKKANNNIGNSMLGKLEKVTDSWNLETLNFVKKTITQKTNGDTPLGFSFGADDGQKVTFKDMLYVNPEADPDRMLTWVYTKLPAEKILGKSATEHPRVHFLDPAIHGGSYLFPKIYIEPASYGGWLGMVKAFLPEMEVCDDVDNGFLQINDIARRAKKIEGSLPIDKRLSQEPECRFEVPYDRQLTPANHGILEGLIISALRTYGTEFILRTLPILGSIRLSSDNYDDSLFMMMAEKIEQEFIAEGSSIDFNFVKSYTYYLLFIEQCVQVAQRQIKEGLLDETPEMTNALEALNKVQMNFERSDDTAVAIRQTIKGAAIIGHNDEWEEKFKSISPDKYRRKLAIMRLDKRRMARKVAAIHDSRRHAQVFLAALLKREMSSLSDRISLNMRPLPHAWDIKKLALSKNGVVNFSETKSGLSTVEVQVVEGSGKPEYGKIMNCPDSQLVSSSTSNMESLGNLPERGIMFIEKYLRVISKDDTEQVMTISEFKEMISNTEQYDPNLKISDYFGNAVVLNNKFFGSIGVKFGVRLIYVPHSSLNLIPNLDELKERVGKIRGFYHIPMASYEHDLLDKAIKDIDLDDEDLGEDTKCYIDKLSESKDFKFLFETIIKTTTFTSLFGIYSYYNFFECIGLGPDEVEEDRRDKIKNQWKRTIFNDVKVTIKKQFRSTYQSDDDDYESSKQEKRKFDAKWLSNLLPDSYLGLDGSVRWWQSARIVDINPFNKDGNECLNDFQKLFKD